VRADEIDCLRGIAKCDTQVRREFGVVIAAQKRERG